MSQPTTSDPLNANVAAIMARAAAAPLKIAQRMIERLTLVRGDCLAFASTCARSGESEMADFFNVHASEISQVLAIWRRRDEEIRARAAKINAPGPITGSGDAAGTEALH